LIFGILFNIFVVAKCRDTPENFPSVFLVSGLFATPGTVTEKIHLPNASYNTIYIFSNNKCAPGVPTDWAPRNLYPSYTFGINLNAGWRAEWTYEVTDDLKNINEKFFEWCGMYVIIFVI